ncbi:MAG: transglycosylase domain-containing protein [Bdellovibrionales bacterium]|nr:transglycosylase domain-containing protein [Bdellovibrionales bacterium]
MNYIKTPDIKNIGNCIVTKETQIQLCSSNPHFVKLEDVSEHLLNAILVAEDISFFHHHGFDIFEIKESFLTNLKKFRFARGGSTITQQMIKNVYLSQEKSLSRKVQEAILTFKVENTTSKKRIFELYLNAIEFGKEIYGIKSASYFYFNKSPLHLNILESAFLAFLLPNPKKYMSSYENKVLSPFAEKRLKDIIEKLYFYKKISEEQWQVALQHLSLFPWQSLDIGTEFLLIKKFDP